MKNKIFQILWYIIKGFIPRKEASKHGFLAFSKRLYIQVKLASFFGEIENVFIGDSNSETFSRYNYAVQMKGISVFLGIGGMRLEHWVDFLKNYHMGQKIYSYIKDSRVFCNLGGNNVLQKRLEFVEGSIIQLNKMFKNIVWINVPCIHYSFLVELDPLYNRDFYDKNILIVNDLIKKHAGENTIVIDAYKMTFDANTREGKLGWFEDPVHYSKLARNVFMQIFKNIEKYGLGIKNIVSAIFLAFVLGCSSAPKTEIVKTLDSIMKDETIPQEIRVKVAKKLLDENIEAINVVYKKNQDLEIKNEKLEKKIESNKWKVDIVNTFIYIILFILFFYLIRFISRVYLNKWV